MTKESKDERMTEKELDAQSASGHPMKRPLSVESELPEGMRKPEAAGEQGMGGVHKGSASGGNDGHLGNSNMGAAVKQLNYETERHEHAPSVGGHHDAGRQHHGVLTKD